MESRWQDADHRMALLIELDRAPHNTRVGAKLSLPQTVTEQQNLVTALPVLFGEIPAIQRLHAKSGEPARRNAGAIDAFRFTAAGQVKCDGGRRAELAR